MNEYAAGLAKGREEAAELLVELHACRTALAGLGELLSEAQDRCLSQKEAADRLAEECARKDERITELENLCSRRRGILQYVTGIIYNDKRRD